MATTQATQYHIPCDGKHERNVPDYYPLTIGKIIDLLETARALKDHVGMYPYAVQEISSIQIRLGQGIPGMVCPYEIDGPVAEKHNALDHAYVAWIQDPMTLFLKETPITATDRIVVTLAGLMGIAEA